MAKILADFQRQSRREIFTEKVALADDFLVKLGAFLGHFRFVNHPGHAVPELPRPLVSLWVHPYLISVEKTVPMLRE